MSETRSLAKHSHGVCKYACSCPMLNSYISSAIVVCDGRYKFCISLLEVQYAFAWCRNIELVITDDQIST